AWVIRGAKQRREKDRLFHQEMVLISKKPKEFEDGRNVGDFDPFTSFQHIKHSIEDIQPTPNDYMILYYKFGALHISILLWASRPARLLCKKKVSKLQLTSSGTSWSVYDTAMSALLVRLSTPTTIRPITDRCQA